VKIPFTDNLRVPDQRSSDQGQSGPKPRPKGVGDGKRVNIPVPLTNAKLRRDAEVTPVRTDECTLKEVG
jgi:hypothetical protein